MAARPSLTPQLCSLPVGPQSTIVLHTSYVPQLLYSNIGCRSRPYTVDVEAKGGNCMVLSTEVKANVLSCTSYFASVT